MKDICAVSTPLAEGGISVIRISGENAISIGERFLNLCHAKVLKTWQAIRVHTEK